MNDSECSLIRIQQLSGVMMLSALLSMAGTQAKASDELIQVLQERSCRGCRLADADLVHADLRDADLSDAKLMRANLGQAQLDGADLSGADLSFTSLRGASLRGANLTGTLLYGTDLRDADLTGAQLNPNALDEAHWQGASGISAGIRSHAALHNAGVEAFQAGRWSAAEQLFSDAISRQPGQPLSWVARGICRGEQAKDDVAAADFRYAAVIYEKEGQATWAMQLRKAAESIQGRRLKEQSPNEGNGLGIQLLSNTIAGLRMLAPIAAKALIPMGLGF
ncbi:pentapeptide repeats family protein [Synechococcus sp. BIOS-E4-1]|uniref:pentapeptide repeat-containing protein n=1 Tax=Synechococcus sp. BIOS-E4-1 TaxID=1400864 RepID=UPI0016443D41|nr:pentapeptide repeat-containing protein [Synechococcus sp. BIOS-E4-1]QNI56665.1 pentapeptide repeats family protein [Synechococcus sp. BIOS-E4-1]